MSLIRHRRRTFVLYKETGMQKWAGMLVETGKEFVDLSAMMTQMREDSDFWSLQPFHEMDRYRWNIFGLCEMRWKNFGETATEEGHKVFFSGKEDKHENGVGFLVHKDIVNTVMRCRPVSSRLITIRLRAVPFNITIVQA